MKTAFPTIVWIVLVPANLRDHGTSVAARDTGRAESGKEHGLRTNTTRALIVGFSVVAAGLLCACGGALTAAEDTSATATSAAPSTSASESRPEPESPETTSPAEGEGSGGVDCGKVAGTNGEVGVFAEDTSAGTVGCTEAINVITEYYADAPTKGEGTAYALTVDGWYCLTDSGAQGSGAAAWEKDGLTFHTRS